MLPWKFDDGGFGLCKYSCVPRSLAILTGEDTRPLQNPITAENSPGREYAKLFGVSLLGVYEDYPLLLDGAHAKHGDAIYEIGNESTRHWLAVVSGVVRDIMSPYKMFPGDPNPFCFQVWGKPNG